VEDGEQYQAKISNLIQVCSSVKLDDNVNLGNY
jgi:hypothetical protein